MTVEQADFFRMITELEKVMTLEEIGEAVGRAGTSVCRYKNGIVPRHDVGEAIRELYRVEILQKCRGTTARI